MTRRFNVGDRVQVVNGGCFPRLVGTVATIVAVCDLHSDCYITDIRMDGGLVSAPGIFLRPYYDGGEPAKWSDCAWKPNEVAA